MCDLMLLLPVSWLWLIRGWARLWSSINAAGLVQQQQISAATGKSTVAASMLEGYTGKFLTVIENVKPTSWKEIQLSNDHVCICRTRNTFIINECFKSLSWCWSEQRSDGFLRTMVDWLSDTNDCSQVPHLYSNLWRELSFPTQDWQPLCLEHKRECQQHNEKNNDEWWKEKYIYKI